MTVFLGLSSAPAIADQSHENTVAEKSDASDGAYSTSISEEKRVSNYAVEQLYPMFEEGESGNDGLFKFLAVLVIIALLFILGYAVKVLDKVYALTGSRLMPDVNLDLLNSRLFMTFLILFFGGIIYELAIHSKYLLPESASEHGKNVDSMMNITFIITGIVFVATHILLFYFAFRYRYKKSNRALYYPENDKLEAAWTIIPAIALTVLVLAGFRYWNDIMDDPEGESVEVELYAYQFGWKFRYPGPDGILGKTDFRLTSTENPLGLDPNDPHAQDDIVGSDFKMPKGIDVMLRMRSQDVLHAAFLPHFRAQMYCVPGTPTRFKLKPTITTVEMRQKLGRDKFNFELACNQICGAAHYNMQREIEVLEINDYNQWLSEQTAFFGNSQSSKLTAQAD